MNSLTKEARERFAAVCNADALARVLPYKEVETRFILVEMVSPYDKTRFNRASYQPANFRRGCAEFTGEAGTVTPSTLGMVAPGLSNALVSSIIWQDLVDQGQQMFHFLAAQLLQHGYIHFEDEAVMVTAHPLAALGGVVEYEDCESLLAAVVEKTSKSEEGGHWKVITYEKTVPLLFNDALPGVDVIEIGSMRDIPQGDIIVRQYIWNPNIVTAVWCPTSDAVPGRVALTPGENPEDFPGVWVRHQYTAEVPLTGPQKPPSAFGDSYQVGIAGLPVLDHPERVFIFRPKTGMSPVTDLLDYGSP